jgi:hypothetical protein
LKRSEVAFDFSIAKTTTFEIGYRYGDDAPCGSPVIGAGRPAIRGSRDDPSPFVDVVPHQAFLSHFQQEGLASFLIHGIGALHDLVDFQRLFAKRAQDIFSTIQHDQNPKPSALDQ